MSVITYPLNGVEYYAEDVESYLCTRTSGVFASTNNFVATVTGDNRVVTIGTGLAWIKPNTFSGKSITNTTAATITIPLSNGTLPRKDRIVLRFDSANNMSSFVLLQGTPASTPQSPAISRTSLIYDLCLYEILVPAGSTVVTQDNITNTMMDESICGIMRDGVTGIPTAQLQSQVNALIEELRETILEIEVGTDTMLQSAFNPDNGTGQVAFKADVQTKVLYGTTDPSSELGNDGDIYIKYQ